jgi:hypothetical protein
MRLMGVVVVCALAGCEHKQSNRWPDHRQLEEARISALEKQIVEIKALEKRIHDLEAAAAGPAVRDGSSAPPSAP